MNKKKVLVIDDESVVLNSVHKILTSCGYDVETTSRAKIGVDRALKEPFHIVLTDIRMPEMDGLTVLRDIKRVKPTLPVLIITGYASVNSAIQAMKLGAANYIEKPFEPDELARAVSGVIDSSSGILQEEQTIIHIQEMLDVLQKGANDPEFARKVFEEGADVLAEYHLTHAEKLAIITGDIDWIEDQVGIVDHNKKQWLMNKK
ncbi:MAG: response regulator [Desulfobacula sp.]|jgi:DNA-binding NtrC family response regulator